MAKVTALKCPNCQAHISLGQSKCEYCGAGIIISQDSSSYLMKSQSHCPKCGMNNESSSWFCLKCNTILTENIEMLRRLQKRYRLEQKRVKETYLPSWMKTRLESDEFLYYVLKLTNNKDDFYLITDRRIIKYHQNKLIKIPLSEAISVSPVQTQVGFFSGKYFFDLYSSKGSTRFEFNNLDINGCQNIYNRMQEAMEDYANTRKDVRAVIVSLTLEEPSQMVNCVSCGESILKKSKFCSNCGKPTTQ